MEKFKQMEIEKKKTRPSKRVFEGSVIRYHSMSMPLIEESPRNRRKTRDAKETKIDDELNISGVFKLEDDDELV